MTYSFSLAQIAIEAADASIDSLALPEQPLFDAELDAQVAAAKAAAKSLVAALGGPVVSMSITGHNSPEWGAVINVSVSRSVHALSAVSDETTQSEDE